MKITKRAHFLLNKLANAKKKKDGGAGQRAQW